MLRQVRILIVLSTLVVAGCGTTNSSGKSGSDRDRAVADHVKLGVTYLQQEANRDSARFHLRKALELDSRSPQAHYGMAMLYQSEGENTEAEKHYKQALKYDSGATNIQFYYGIFLFGQDRFKEAYQQFSSASEDLHYENRAQTFLSLGLTARKLGLIDEAQTAYSRALDLKPRMTGPYLELAELHWDAGNKVLAKQYLDTFHKMAKSNSRSLWLAIRVEDAFGNRDAVSSNALKLTKLFPYSQETLDYNAWRRGAK